MLTPNYKIAGRKRRSKMLPLHVLYSCGSNTRLKAGPGTGRRPWILWAANRIKSESPGFMEYRDTVINYLFTAANFTIPKAEITTIIDHAWNR